MLKHQLQIFYRFLDSQDLFLVTCEHAGSRELGFLNNVHFSAREPAPSLNGAKGKTKRGERSDLTSVTEIDVDIN